MQRSWCAFLLGAACVVAPGRVFAQGPFTFVPSGQDDSVALRSALIQYRWVRIAGPEIRIDSPVHLQDDAGMPLDGVVIEPAPGLSRVRVRTAIAGNPEDVTDPSRAPFNYNGGFAPTTALAEAVDAGANSIVVRDPAGLIDAVTGQPVVPLTAGEYVCVNDASRMDPAPSPFARDVRDGTVEVRRVVAIQSAGPGTLRYVLDAPLRRAHQALVVVVRCRPIRNVVMRNLEFVTDPGALPRAGIHMHNAFDARLDNITSTAWRGFTLILLDTGGQRNTVNNCFARGANTPTSMPSGWGIAVEGQEDTVVADSGADAFLTGIMINYSANTRAVNGRVSNALLVGMLVHADGEGNPSIASGFVGGSVTGGGFGAFVGPNCRNCTIDVDMLSPVLGVFVSLGATDTRIAGTITNPLIYGVAIELIDGGPGDGAVTSMRTYLDTLATCSPSRLVLVKGSLVVPKAPIDGEGYYQVGTRFTVCS